VTLRLLTLEEVAGVLGCSTRTVRRRVDAGALPVYRDGRIVRVPEAALEGYVRTRTVAPPPLSSSTYPLRRRAPVVTLSATQKLTAVSDPLAPIRVQAT
jgi:excisionase family DNA binding protein